MTIEDMHRDIDKLWPRHLRTTRDILRIPSVSMTGEGIQETAGALSEMLSEMGAKVTQFKANSDSHPMVVGDLDVGASKTALLYGMYDVQPPGDPDLWDQPPFGATIVKREPFGKVLVNRGVFNSKASLVGTLLAIETMLERDELPMNVHFLLEGEEELGGDSFPKYVRKNKTKLSKADVAFGFDYGENANGIPVISLGMKGCMYLDLSTRGSKRGGPMNGDIHSSDAVIIESPVWRLVKAISSMVDENQDPAIDGMWEDVVEPSKEDLALVRKLCKVFDPVNYAREAGVEKFKVKGSKEKLLRKYLFEPSLNIDGIVAGYNGEGSKTILPDSARAKIDIRLVPNMSIERTYKRVADHLKKRGFSDLKIGRYEDYPWTKVSVNETVSKACIEAMRYHGREPEIWPMTAGSAPFYLFDQFLGVPWGCAGLGHGGKAHAPNEFAVVDGMREFEKSVVTLFWKFVETSEKGS
ncbi:MAG: M20/M25/M40 family metallo-hydrolase [Methanobacteriota archaeon]|nr:MAG: M20/M25/M40 family metallo-hydrolase [Euryarchaeota archaeon]